VAAAASKPSSVLTLIFVVANPSHLVQGIYSSVGRASPPKDEIKDNKNDTKGRNDAPVPKLSKVPHVSTSVECVINADLQGLSGRAKHVPNE